MRLMTILVLGLCALAGALPANAQEEQAPAPVIILEQPELTPPFSRPVDPDLYVIRPGDQIQVTFVKSQIEPITFDINPEGQIVDRTIGVHDLAFKTLSQAREILERVLSSLYNIPGITVGVTRSRLVTITVTGAVAAPGSYQVYTSERVSDVIAMAGGILGEGSSRWILFTGGPNAVKVDLDRAVFLGDQISDPNVYAGHTIHVPVKSGSTVQVTGEVLRPREIELVPGDDLRTMIALAGGLRGQADSASTRIINRSGSEGSRDNIRAGDIIIVPRQKQSPGDMTVSIFGAVMNPGVLSYRQEMTLADAIERAGGLEADANTALTTIFRRPRFDVQGRFTSVRFPIWDPMKTSENLMSLTLEPNDSLFVPIRVGFVRVNGAVLNPGVYAHRAGKDALFYIQTAGGFLPTAKRDEVSVFNPVSNVTAVSPPAITVHDGSTVTVDVREELK